MPLLVLSAGADWLAGESLSGSADRRLRRVVLGLALTLNLGLLAYFKYRGFFIESLTGLGDWAGVEAPFGVGRFVLPVGISFYTFNGMAYAIDVYRGTARRAPSWLHFARRRPGDQRAAAVRLPQVPERSRPGSRPGDADRRRTSAPRTT